MPSPGTSAAAAPRSSGRFGRGRRSRGHARPLGLRLGFALAALAFVARGAAATGIEEGFEEPGVVWRAGESDVTHRLVAHERSAAAARRGRGGERIVLEAASGTVLRFELPVPPTRVIDEWRARLWVRANHPDLRLSARVRLPRFRSARGEAVTVIMPGSVSQSVERWEQLAVGDVATALQRSLPALRAEHGPGGSLDGAEITHLVLDLYSRPGHYEVAIDDLAIEGMVPVSAVTVAAGAAGTDDDAAGGVIQTGATEPAMDTPPSAPDTDPAAMSVPGAGAPAPAPPAAPSAPDTPIAPDAQLPRLAPGAAPAPAPLTWSPPPGAPPAAPASTAPADPVTGINRGILEVAGEPFFPRAIDHNGEPFEVLAALGFNAVRLAAPASSDQIEEARRTGLWIVCPPPQLPEVDVRRPDALPAFSSNWDRVLLWDMGQGLSEADVDTLAEHARRVRTCDRHAGRPLVASADSGLRSLSRHVDMLVARRTVLGTSVELRDWFAWLRERPRLARPGTPFLATLSTEIDARTARQAACLSGVGGRGLAVDPESLSLASLAAVAAGARGILFSSSRRIDADDHESRIRAAAARVMNLRLRLLEPWAAAGRFSTVVTASDPEVRGVVVEAARARMVVAWREAQGSQIVASHYRGDIPAETAPVTLLMNGIPEAHQAWEVSPGGLRPLRHRRVTGGVSVVVDPFRSCSLVLVTGDPAVAAHVQERLRSQSAAQLEAVRQLAGLLLADAGDLLVRIPPLALGRLPGPAMLEVARQDVAVADSLVASDPANAAARYERAAAIAGQVERLVWEKGVVATGSLVAGALATSDATLVEHWRFVEALASTSPGPELLPGGGMERIDELSGGGWRHFARSQATLRTAVEVSRAAPASGRGSLVMRVDPVDAAAAPVIVETPPVWITTPPLAVPPGKLVQIEARVWVPRPVKGSVDGLVVFDSIGGPALAERVGPSPQWRRLVLYRVVPEEAGPLSVTFALTGLGEARLDDVSVRILERGGIGVPPEQLAGDAQRTPFPGPGEVLAPAPTLPPVQPGATAAAGNPSAAPAASGWPAMTFDWPKLPFGTSSDVPPPGPGGGRLDPFKRAGVGATLPTPQPPLPEAPLPPALEEPPLPPEPEGDPPGASPPSADGAPAPAPA